MEPMGDGGRGGGGGGMEVGIQQAEQIGTITGERGADGGRLEIKQTKTIKRK